MSLRSGTIEKVRKRSMGANGTARFHRNQTTMSDKKRTIYIGNLDRRVTEYMLIKLFQPFGSITREHYTWHKVGEKRGVPRGYAFIEYKTREECVKAQKAMDGEMLLGRALTVRYAADKEYESEDAPEKDRFQVKAKPAIKMSPADKIRAIEEKLRKMKELNKKKGIPKKTNGPNKSKSNPTQKSSSSGVKANEKGEREARRPRYSTSSTSREKVRYKPY
ncbi:hypothetical protein AAMO2058_001144400 [Amorphochlora amoebiformis]